MKKRFLIILSCFALVFATTLTLTGGFTKGVLSRYIYFPRNVYEEIWNLVLSEEYGGNTVLSSIDSTYVDYDLGMFQSIYIPDCNMVLSWWDGLSFQFRTEKGKYIHFVYDYDSQTLSGDAEAAYLAEHFLQDYFQWCKASPDFSSNYSMDDLGEFSYQYADPVYTYGLSD